MARDNGLAIPGEYETPFADETMLMEVERQPAGQNIYDRFSREFESPFSLTYESGANGLSDTPRAEAFVEMLAELHDEGFNESLHAIANELEENVLSRFNSETASGEQYSRYAKERTHAYLAPLYNEVDAMIDKVSSFLAQNQDATGQIVERFIDELEFDHNGQLSPAQEQFFGKVLKKVKNVAKKVKSVAGKFSPVQIALDKIKGLIKPLMTKVLNSLIGKLPANLQPVAQTLAKKYLNQEVAVVDPALAQSRATLAGVDLDAIQREFDLYVSDLVFETGEMESEALISNYVYESEAVSDEGSSAHTLSDARRRFVTRLREGGDIKPAIEQFVPAIMGAVKIAISLVGRDRVVKFLSDLVVKLVAKWVPAQTAKPLATSIVDLGLKSMGFEVAERDHDDLAYEAIANTVEEVVRTIGAEPEMNRIDRMSDTEAFEHLTEYALPAFNQAVVNNFPGHFVKRELQPSRDPDVWVLMPRKEQKKSYKKYTKVFQVSITPQISASLKTFGGVPLAQFLKDTLGITSPVPVQARVHIYEAIPGTWLSKISMYERVPGLGSADKSAWTQLHPLTVQAATALLNEPGLGKDVDATLLGSPDKIGVGQRFYYLEIPGVSVRRPWVVGRTHRHKEGHNGTQIIARTSDIQAVINFVRSEIMLNYFFSEADANNVVEKLNRNDWMGAAEGIRTSLRDTLGKILLSKAGSKVKIVHESVPELYMDHIPETEQFAGAIAKVALEKIIEKLAEKFVDAGFAAVKNFFKARAAEFKEALARPEDGVTVRLTWTNVPGMAQIRSVIRLIRGEGSLTDLTNITFPSIGGPDITIIEGKNFA